MFSHVVTLAKQPSPESAMLVLPPKLPEAAWSLMRARLRSLLLLLLLACESRVDGVSAVLVSGPSSEARLDAALPKAPSVRLSVAAAELLSEGGAMADAPEAILGLAESARPKALFEDPALRALLLGRDEGAAATALLKQGVKIVALHRAITPALDRGRTVLSRLYNHDQLSQFSLVRVTDGLLLYRVLERPLSFPPALAELCVNYLRYRLKGGVLVELPKIKSENGRWVFMATLRSARGGREQAVAFAQDGTLQGALEELAVDLERQHRREIELWGFRPLYQEMDDLRLEIQRVVERAEVEPRDEAALEDLWEMGIDGAFMMTKDQKERGFLPGSVAYTRAVVRADDFLRATAAQGGMSERRPWRDPDAMLELLRTLHYREQRALDAGADTISKVQALYRGVPPVRTEDVTLASVRAAILSSGNWYLKNLYPDGRVTYKVWPAENRYSDEYNHVRHTLATWNLVQAWRLDPRPEYLEGAQRALRWTNLSRKDEGDRAVYEYGGNRKLGSAVVGLLGILDLAEATGDHQWDDLMARLGRFTMAMQLPSGTFNGYDVPEGHPYHGQQNDIVPGEAALALVRLAEHTNDDTWISGLPKFWAYYKPWFESRAAKRDPDAPWPAMQYDNDTRLELVQFGPWTVMAANVYHRRTGDKDVARFGLDVARWMIESYAWDADRAPFPDYIGGYYKLAGELPAMQAFCYAEGTAAAYQLALRFAPEEAPFFEQKTRETLRFALNMQYTPDSVYPFTRGDEVMGGIRYALNETKVRIDYVYHAQSALYQWYEAALTDPNLPAAVRGAVSATGAPAEEPTPALQLPPPTPGPSPARGLEQKEPVPEDETDPEAGD